MLRNYFKIAWRSFIKDKVYASINLTGLAIALASVLMIAAFVKYELSFDKYFNNANRIYRLAVDEKKDSLDELSFMMPDALPYTLKEEFPEIESVSNLSRSKSDFKIHDKTISIEYLEVDSSFFHIFNFQFIYGNANTSLKENGNIVLTESAAEKLFPEQDAIGQKLNYTDYQKIPRFYIVTGIIKDIPPNTHFSADGILAHTMVQEPLDWRGYGSSGVKYILLKKGVDIHALENKIPSIYSKYHFQEHTKIVFQPVTSIHLYSHIKDEPFPTSDIKYIYIFSFVALLILFIACINYINLTTARSLQRVMEVGMRKVLGAEKRHLAFQFIAESVLFFLLTLPFAFIIAFITWPLFATTLNLNVGSAVLINWKFIIAALFISLIAGFFSGAYPAFFLSRLKPIAILKDWQKSFVVNVQVRKSLIVFQFFISMGLIIATIVVYQQLSLLNNMELGFNKNYLLTLPAQSFDGKAASFKNELKSGKDIVDVSMTGWRLGNYNARSSMSQPIDSMKDWNFGFISIDTDFLKTLQIKLLAGRNFSATDQLIEANMDSLRKSASQSHDKDKMMNVLAMKPIIITKTTAENLGLKEPVVGQALKLSALQGNVIGEINDFKGVSLLDKNPMVILQSSSQISFGSTYIRINSKNIPHSIAFIESTWHKFFPDNIFEFSFMDEQVSNLYKEQQQLATLFTTFAILAIIISLLGLFSLIALIAQQRRKEIGIRKVLGASVFEIISLLSANFIKLIFIALLITVPFVWWAMNTWLRDFQYRISISWWIFVLTGLGSVSIALVTIAIQATRAARANPVDSLRSE